jgi:hypothetical protein
MNAATILKFRGMVSDSRAPNPNAATSEKTAYIEALAI